MPTLTIGAGLSSTQLIKSQPRLLHKIAFRPVKIYIYLSLVSHPVHGKTTEYYWSCYLHV